MTRESGRRLERLVSGGQTGADRAALDWALAHGVPHGGWCPRGRRAEDGVIGARYDLAETPGSDYAERTERNVRDSDATVIVSISPALGGGSRLTADLARALGRPCLHLSRVRDGAAAPGRLCEFIAVHAIRVLNVAGPRASSEPEIGAYVTALLTAALGGE